MKKISVKQLIIIFVIGVVLVNGGQLLAFRSMGYDNFDREDQLTQLVKEGKITEEKMEELIENGDFHKNFDK